MILIHVKVTKDRWSSPLYFDNEKIIIHVKVTKDGWSSPLFLDNEKQKYMTHLVIINYLLIYSRPKYFWCPQNKRRFFVSYKNVKFSNLATFPFCSPFSYCSPNFAIAKDVTFCLTFCISFIDWFMASILYYFPYSYLPSNYCNSHSCCSFRLLNEK